MPTVPFSSEEIYRDLRRRIEAAEPGYQPGDQLPVQEALADVYGVSRWTIIRVIGQLRTDGLVVTRGGRGTLVKGHPMPEDHIAEGP